MERDNWQLEQNLSSMKTFLSLFAVLVIAGSVNAAPPPIQRNYFTTNVIPFEATDGNLILGNAKSLIARDSLGVAISVILIDGANNYISRSTHASGNAFYGNASATATGKVFIQNKNAVAMTIDANRRVGIGTTSPTGLLTLTSNLVFIGLAAEPTEIAGSAQIYAATNTGVTELYVQGSDGVETQISPHADDAPSFLYDKEEGDMKEIVWRERDPNLDGGKISFINMRRMAKITELNSGVLLYLSGDRSPSSVAAYTRLKVMKAEQRQILSVESLQEYQDRTENNVK